MARYIRKRAATGALIVIVSILLNFFLIHAAPGDPITILSGQDKPSPQAVAALKAKYGLDQPISVQLLRYIKNLLNGDLGTSILTNRPVIKMLGERIGATLLLALSTAILSVIVGTALGIYGARYNGSRIDTFMCGVSYLLDSMPSFWLGLMLMLLLASKWKLLPTSGMINLRAGYEGWAHVVDVLRHLILPATTLTLVSIPYFFRIARSSVMQVMSEDYVVTYRATGMSERRIFSKYVFKNAILPTVTVFGITLAYIVTGVSIIEIVFAWPGMGSFMLSAIMRRDYPLLMGIYLVLSISVSVTMLLVDILYAVIDPRIRFQ